jgi:arsenate reductase
VLREIGIDWSAATSKGLGPFLGRPFDHVITAATTIHWDLEDPAEVDGTEEQKLDAFRRTREQLTRLLAAFVETEP